MEFISSAESSSELGHQGEFDAAAHGIDAFRADADAISEFPLHGSRRFAAGDRRFLARTAAGVTARKRDDSVVTFAIDNPGTRSFFEGVDGQQSLDEKFQEFDEAAIFLH